VPNLDDTWKLLSNIVDDFKSSLSGVKRVENVIYPILKNDR